ncbi:hypothetical protein BJX66DRAFT_334620 [Aspergillus keveii]|uniref:YjgF-like protein n=1 Tax=Aspergillus keveii TaxID=714993 RepID=A0ABR4GFY4_9EURO
MPSTKTTYQWLPGPVGAMLRTSSLATTASIPLSPTTTLITTTGHIGLDLSTGELVTSTVEAEFNAIFNCLDAALRNAGMSGGLGDAHKVVAYFVHVEDEKVMLDLWRERFPGKMPTWTSVVVGGIVVRGVRAEVQVEGVVYAED